MPIYHINAAAAAWSLPPQAHQTKYGLLRENTMQQKQMKTNAVAMMTAVNFSEMKISGNPAETLVAFSIGSGIGVTAFDPVNGSDRHV